MKNINITVENKRATVVGSPMIICGNSDYTVTFTFDNEWSLTGPKTARFVYLKRGEVLHEDKVFEGNTVAVPVLSDVAFVNVGVFAGDLCTTTPARVNCHPSILCGSGIVQEPTPDVYSQIMALFEEMAEKGAFGATEEQMQLVEQNRQGIAALEAGTKKAGKAAAADNATNASKLDGHTVDYFATAAAISTLTTLVPIKVGDGQTVTNCDELAIGTMAYVYYTATNSPFSSMSSHVFTYGLATNLKVQIAIGASKQYVKVRSCSSGTWSAWSSAFATTADLATELAKYLPLTGGMASDNIGVERTNSVESKVVAKNAEAEVSLRASTIGGHGIYSNTHGKWIVQTKADGTTTVDGALLLNGGGTVSGAVAIENNSSRPLTIKRTDADTNLYLQFVGQTGNFGSLGFLSADKPIFLPASGSGSKELLHTGNSAKVVVDTSAPSDTSSVWFDTSSL